jgi:hypothetical protein
MVIQRRIAFVSEFATLFLELVRHFSALTMYNYQ